MIREHPAVEAVIRACEGAVERRLAKFERIASGMAEHAMVLERKILELQRRVDKLEGQDDY